MVDSIRGVIKNNCKRSIREINLFPSNLSERFFVGREHPALRQDGILWRHLGKKWGKPGGKNGEKTGETWENLGKNGENLGKKWGKEWEKTGKELG